MELLGLLFQLLEASLGVEVYGVFGVLANIKPRFDLLRRLNCEHRLVAESCRNHLFPGISLLLLALSEGRLPVAAALGEGQGGSEQSIYPNKALLEAFETHGDEHLVETGNGNKK